MPLTKNESKTILLNAFRLALAVSEKRTDDATAAYSNILDSALAQGNDSDDDMPPLISLGKPESNIKLVISEIEQQQQWHQDKVPFAFASVPTAMSPECDADDYDDEAVVEELGQDTEESVGEESVVEEEPADDEAEESVGEEEEAEESVVEDAVAEEEEVEELELEPVRIKKVIYWKDSKSGDIYVCLPEDEVGDKVGRYVDGKPVFD
jgi:cobalamin biosynthesis protein CobT